MNATLRAICGLLQDEDAELQEAAIRVLGAIQIREPGVYKAMGELLINTPNPVIFRELLHTFQQHPHEHALKYLLDILERVETPHEQVLDTIASIGGKAVMALRRQFERAASSTKHMLVRVLPRIRTDQAHALLLECFFSEDHDLVREAVHSLRQEIHDYEKKEHADLYARLTALLRDKRLAANEAALSALIITLGILADIRCKGLLLPYTDAEYPRQIRRHALMSLNCLEFAGDKHHDVFEAVHPILDEEEWEDLVRYAVQVLDGIKPRRGDAARLQELLQSRHAGVQAYAIRALGQIDSITNAQMILAFLHHRDLHLREVAGEALRQMPSAVVVILRNLDEVRGRKEAHEMVNILEAHANRIKPDKARAMTHHMFELYDAGDEHFDLYRTALRHLRGDILQKEIAAEADKAWRKKDYARVERLLRLLEGTDLLTEEIRYRLALASLKASKKERSRSHRLSDPCLEHLRVLLHEDPKEFKRKLTAEKLLDPDDLLYVGFHFSEQLNEERRFGADLLRFVIKKSPRSKAGKTAKQKLRVEGH